jgi:hypothetical protein
MIRATWSACRAIGTADCHRTFPGRRPSSVAARADLREVTSYAAFGASVTVGLSSTRGVTKVLANVSRVQAAM